ncbi:hypothetical protein ACWFR5_23895 [Streptomyces sp. NPDC055092]
MIPIQLDPPEHKPWRHLFAGHFSPKRMAALRPRLRSGCRELLDEIAARDGCDYVAEFAERFPTLVFLELVGLPASDGPDDAVAPEHEQAARHGAASCPERAITLTSPVTGTGPTEPPPMGSPAQPRKKGRP